MAVPAPVLTVIPNSVTPTEANLFPHVQLHDTVAHDPVATSRTFRAAGNTVVSTTGNHLEARSVAWPVTGLGAGVTAMTVNTVNSEGNGTSPGVNLTVTDGVANQAPVLTKYGISRQAPDRLPREYRDPTVATPGLPTVPKLQRARLTGTIAAAS